MDRARERGCTEEGVTPTTFPVEFVKSNKTTEAAVSTPSQSCSRERKGYAKKLGIATQQAQRCDLAEPIRATIHG